MRSWTVPRWVLVLLAAVASVSAASGFWLEFRHHVWTSVHPYSINLISAITGFAFSALFASLIWQRITFESYRRRWGYVTASLVTPLVNRTLRALSSLTHCADTRLSGLIAEVADDQVRYGENPLTARPAGFINVVAGVKSALQALAEEQKALDSVNDAVRALAATGLRVPITNFHSRVEQLRRPRIWLWPPGSETQSIDQLLEGLASGLCDEQLRQLLDDPRPFIDGEAIRKLAGSWRPAPDGWGEIVSELEQLSQNLDSASSSSGLIPPGMSEATKRLNSQINEELTALKTAHELLNKLIGVWVFLEAQPPQRDWLPRRVQRELNPPLWFRWWRFNWGGIGTLYLDRRFLRRYGHYELDRYSLVDLQGLITRGIYALSLDQTFVEQKISLPSRTGSRISASPRARYTTSTLLDDMTNRALRLTVVGSPGSGKSILVRSLTFMLCKRLTESHSWVIRPRSIPVLIMLREAAPLISDNIAVGIDELTSKLMPGLGSIPPGWFGRQLALGRCVLLFDGLDEVIGDQRQILSWVQSLIETYSNCSLILTTRPIADFAALQADTGVLDEFGNEEIRQFIRRWYRATDAQRRQLQSERIDQQADKAAADLLVWLDANPQIAALARNPLLLTMLVQVYYYRGKFPSLLSDFYGEVVDVLLQPLKAKHPQSRTSSWASIRGALSSVAFHAIEEGSADFTKDAIVSAAIESDESRQVAQELVDDIADNGDLLVETPQNEYRFAHLTMQEYFAADYVRRGGLVDQLLIHLADPRWRNVIIFYCSMADPSPIVAACLDRRTDDSYLLLLARDCAREARSLPSWLAKELRQALAEVSDIRTKE
jgi:NACHT domain